MTAKANLNLRNRVGNTALMAAASAGHGDAVSALLAAGADPGLVNSDHRTALDIARLSHQDTVAKLLDR